MTYGVKQAAAAWERSPAKTTVLGGVLLLSCIHVSANAQTRGPVGAPYRSSGEPKLIAQTYLPYPGGHLLAYDTATQRFEDLGKAP
jgi:hypothetical protein